jgi:hypothetical protein
VVGYLVESEKLGEGIVCRDESTRACVSSTEAEATSGVLHHLWVRAGEEPEQGRDGSGVSQELGSWDVRRGAIEVWQRAQDLTDLHL